MTKFFLLLAFAGQAFFPLPSARCAPILWEYDTLVRVPENEIVINSLSQVLGEIFNLRYRGKNGQEKFVKFVFVMKQSELEKFFTSAGYYPLRCELLPSVSRAIRDILSGKISRALPPASKALLNSKKPDLIYGKLKNQSERKEAYIWRLPFKTSIEKPLWAAGFHLVEKSEILKMAGENEKTSRQTIKRRGKTLYAITSR